MTHVHQAGPDTATIMDSFLNANSDPIDHNTLPPVGVNLIDNTNDSRAANIFCFAAFVDKQTGILCNDLTGLFPFMSLEGNTRF
jgi:hypothetical protein